MARLPSQRLLVATVCCQSPLAEARDNGGAHGLALHSLARPDLLRSSLIYLHTTRERDQRIAAGMGQLFKDATAARQADSQPEWPLHAS